MIRCTKKLKFHIKKSKKAHVYPVFRTYLKTNTSKNPVITDLLRYKNEKKTVP